MTAFRLLAGDAARTRIENEGLRPDMIEILAGAAGGPKWLALGQLDRYLFGTWFAGRQQPLHTVGSSIGSWRFALAAQPDPVATINRFEDAYLSVEYDSLPPTIDEITQRWSALLTDILDAEGIQAVLQHPYLRPHIITALCVNASRADEGMALKRGLAQLAWSNLRGRPHLARHLERVIFGPPSSDAGFLPFDDAFQTHYVDLQADNLIPALLGSSSVPLLMRGVTDIPGAPAGMYRDGGLIDYHLALHYRPRGGLVFMPHFNTRIVPGWLDKMLPWRRPDEKTTDNLVLLAPSDELLARLPHGKVPDRKDFQRYRGNMGALYADWKKAADTCGELAEAFARCVEEQSFARHLEPFPSA